jgi:hypothetical protein
MTSVVVVEKTSLTAVKAPALPLAPVEYQQQYQDQFSNILRLYFNQIDTLISQLQLMASTNGSVPVSFTDGSVDAFDRLRVSQPYTLFDSQARYASDSSFDTSTTSGGTATFNTNQSSTSLAVTTTTGSQVVRQTFRYFPYQPGKSLLILCTFCLNAAATGVVKRIGYFDANNGIYFEQNGSTLNMVIRSNVTGTPVNTVIPQSQWNGDKLDGTGASGLTFNPLVTQIFYTDMEWLGVGIVRVGFVINGTYVNCHTFYNANTTNTTVYMTTAILPVRYEITNTDGSAATLTQICATVISEGGYEQVSQQYWVRNNAVSCPSTNLFVPACSIRLNSSHLGAVVLPSQFNFLPIGSANYEVAVVRNVGLTGASWVTGTFQDVDYDISATAFTSQPTGSQICQIDYGASTSQGKTNALTDLGYKWDLQLGTSLAGTSDVLTLAIRTIGATGAANAACGAFGFYDLTL